MRLLDYDIPKLWQDEFYDLLLVLQMGANKYKVDGWLDADGHGTSHDEMHNSMFHHLAKSYSNDELDDESKLDHLLHVATRALMLYTRKKRGIENPGTATVPFVSNDPVSPKDFIESAKNCFTSQAAFDEHSALVDKMVIGEEEGNIQHPSGDSE